MKKIFLMAVATMMATMMWATKPSVTFDFTDPDFQASHPTSCVENVFKLSITQGPINLSLEDDGIYYEDEVDYYLDLSGNNSGITIEATNEYLITRIEFHIGHSGSSYLGLQHYSNFGYEGDNGYIGENLDFDATNFIESADYEGESGDEWLAVETEARVHLNKVVVYYTGGPSTALNENENENENRKVVENGQVIILRNGLRYNLLGQVVE